MDPIEISQLVRQRGVHKAQLTRMRSFLDQFGDGQCISDIEVRLEALPTIFAKYDDVQTKLEIDEATSEHSTDRSEFEEHFYAIKAQMKRLLLQSTDNQAEHLCNSQQTNSSQIKLPAIILPNFDGKIENWLPFEDAFKVLVHENLSLSNIQKYYYLLSSLREEAAQLVRGLAVTEANYVVAWQLLRNRYMNTRLIACAHIRKMLNIKEVDKEDPQQLREFINTATSNLNALKVLHIDTPLEEVILAQLYIDRLDANTKREWEMKHSTQSFPPLTDLFAFLEQKCQALESLNTANSVSKIRASNESKGYGNRSVRQSNTYVCRETQACECCNRAHTLYKCPQFEFSNLETKLKLVRDCNLCYNCLRRGHVVNECPSGGCRTCKGRHHTLLHKETMTRPTQDPSGVSDVHATVSTSSRYQQPPPSISPEHNTGVHEDQPHCAFKARAQSQVLLATAIVMIKDGRGKLQQCRALIDSGSQSNFISEECVQRLQIKKNRNHIPIVGISNATMTTKYSVDIELSSTYNQFRANISCSVLPRITGDMPSTIIQHKVMELPKDIQLADPTFYRPGSIDLLVGAELYCEIMRANKRTRTGNYPTLFETELGWILTGKLPLTESATVSRYSYFIRAGNSLDEQLRKFWELEELHSCPSTQEEQLCESHFSETTTRDETGRFIVRLPHRPDCPQLGDSFDQAKSRLHQLERRLQKNPGLRLEYNAFLEEYQHLGHMTPVTRHSWKQDKDYFLPHHAVLKSQSTTTKLRVVFDGSARTTTGTSLNDTLMVGPVIQQDLYSIILRFRIHVVVFTADIAKMYRQVKMHPSDSGLQRILWRGSTDDQVQCYELTTVTYGTASAPFLATRCLQQLAEEERQRYPLASEILLRDFYVDDLVSGTNDVDTAIKLQQELIALLKTGGFDLRKWCSNHLSLLRTLTPDLIETEFPLQLDDKNSVKTLGLMWSPTTDKLLIANKATSVSLNVTKREVASVVASIYDPLGLISPVVILYKVFLQQLWLSNINWDDNLPDALFIQWKQLVSQIPSVGEIQIDRMVLIKDHVNVQIHGFCDASQKAYGACLYLRSVNESGDVATHLLCSKSRVAPVKSVSIPRLELCGALLLSQLLHKTTSILGVKVDSIHLWSDSTITLAWIAGPAMKWKTFVANRVAQIQENTTDANWKHVSTEDNPADCISRGIDPQSLVTQQLWWAGPKWLSCHPSSWPCSAMPSAEYIPEERPITTSLLATNPVTSEVISRFSKLARLTRVISFCLRFARNCQVKDRTVGNLTATDIHRALHVCIKIVQQEEYHKEIRDLKAKVPISKKSRLVSLHPFLDDQEILRVGGRLNNADIAYDSKHQMIIPSGHHLTTLIIRGEHLRLLHAGPQSLLASLRLQFWIPRAKMAIKQVIHNCITCFRLKAAKSEQLMGQLPTHRVQVNRPFLNTGVDYAGPFSIKSSIRSKITTKCYVGVFICLATRAIHLELISGLSSQAFIAALKRFTARRGHVANLYSDNGTNFVGANRELKTLHKLVLSQSADSDLQNYASQSQLSWHFIPPNSPHFGGLWEAGVKSMKHHLRRVVGTASLTFEEFSTLLHQIEAILNSRPLCTLSEDPTDLSYLSPGHFLIGNPLVSLPEPDLTDLPMNRLSRWQRLQQMQQHIWNRWSGDYLHGLQQRKKWTTIQPNLQPGMVVLLKDDNLPPAYWKLAVVNQVFPGTDGLTRVATVRVGSTLLKRSTHKLIPLPSSID